jgi:hypothetical protein
MDVVTILSIVLILSFPMWVCVQSIIDYKKSKDETSRA